MAYSDIKDPSEYFQTTLYTGNGGTLSVTNDGNSDLQPDWVWIKNRTQYQHQVYDTNRGVHKKLLTSVNNAESTDSTALTSFNTDGFSTGANVGVNQNSTAHVAWQWKCNGGTTSSNTDGSLTSTVQANQDAGFSICTYTTADSDETVGHGLGVAPKIIIIKRTDSDASWTVHLPFLSSSNKQMYLDTTNALDTNNVKEAGASTFRVYGWPGTAVANGTYVAYCFAEKQGYSKFSSYVGNGNSNGPFVHTGFKPAWVMIKRTDTTGSWTIYDNKRGYNGNNYELFPNSSEAEYTGTSYFEADILSNGFKLRLTDGQINASGSKYIYMAFAEEPFVAGGVPTTAR